MEYMMVSWMVLYFGIVLLGVVLAILLVSYHKRIAETQVEILAAQKEIARQLAIIASHVKDRT